MVALSVLFSLIANVQADARMQNGMTNPTCPNGICEQEEAVKPTCVGGSCIQKKATNASCKGGSCIQEEADTPTCDGGSCKQKKAKNPSCLQGRCDQSDATGDDVSCEGGRCKKCTSHEECTTDGLTCRTDDNRANCGENSEEDKDECKCQRRSCVPAKAKSGIQVDFSFVCAFPDVCNADKDACEVNGNPSTGKLSSWGQFFVSKNNAININVPPGKQQTWNFFENKFHSNFDNSKLGKTETETGFKGFNNFDFTGFNNFDFTGNFFDKKKTTTTTTKTTTKKTTTTMTKTTRTGNLFATARSTITFDQDGRTFKITNGEVSVTENGKKLSPIEAKKLIDRIGTFDDNGNFMMSSNGNYKNFKIVSNFETISRSGKTDSGSGSNEWIVIICVCGGVGLVVFGAGVALVLHKNKAKDAAGTSAE